MKWNSCEKELPNRPGGFIVKSSSYVAVVYYNFLDGEWESPFGGKLDPDFWAEISDDFLGFVYEPPGNYEGIELNEGDIIE